VDGTDGGCSVALYATADCSGPPQVTGLSGAATSFTTWSVDSGGSFKNGSSSIRARIECYSTTNAAFSVDMVYLSPDPAHF